MCLARANAAGFVKYQLAALANLAVTSLFGGNSGKARTLLSQVISASEEITYVRLGALDTLAQLELREGQLDPCRAVLAECSEVSAREVLPARSWYDLAHQVTRCAYFEQIEDWDSIVAIADAADAELARRQYKAIRTALLGAKARALARLGRHADASAALAAAVRACPRGAVDPLIVLEASKALCASLRGDIANGSLHYDRAIAACRAIGHRYHEWWITAQRKDIEARTRETVTVAPQADVARTSLLLSDVATILGAGHSVDLLAHRLAAILQATPLAPRVDIANESGRDYRPEPSAEWDTTPDGTCTIRIEGSDRLATITVRDVRSIEEISLVKSLADLVQIAVARTADTEHEDEELTLWPRTVPPEGEDTIFRSPRMIELLRVAERLAATTLPVLITGETGTGKEVIARYIHDHSAQRRGPFVPFNCSAVARELVESQLFGHRRGAFTGAVEAFPGLVKAAERGTLFLDEIGDLESVVQPKLLRFLESGEIQPVGEMRPQRVTVRLVAATNASLAVLAKEGRFRSDSVLPHRRGEPGIAAPAGTQGRDSRIRIAVPGAIRARVRAVRPEAGRRPDRGAAAVRLARQHPAARQRTAPRGGHGHRRPDRRRGGPGAGSDGELEPPAGRTVAHVRAGRGNPSGSTARAGRGRTRAQVHRAGAPRVERPGRRCGAAARPVAQGPVPETSPLRAYLIAPDCICFATCCTSPHTRSRLPLQIFAICSSV